jgi:hypothetical protein
MIEVQLSKQSMEKMIVTFDANVVRHFSVLDVRTSSGASGRIHVGHIKSIEIKDNRKGKPALLITTKFDAPFSNDEVDPDMLEKVKELVAEVQVAMKSSTLWQQVTFLAVERSHAQNERGPEKRSSTGRRENKMPK